MSARMFRVGAACISACVGGIAALAYGHHSGLANGAASLLLILFTAIGLTWATRRLTLESDLPVYGNPATLLLGYLFLLYVARPVADILTRTGGAESIGYFPIRLGDPQLTAALSITMLAVGAFIAGLWLAPGSRFVRRKLLILNAKNLGSRGYAVLFFPLAISCLSSLVVINRLATYGDFYSALTLRHYAFAGANEFVWLMLLYKWSFFAYVAANLYSRTRAMFRGRFLLAFAFWIPTLIFDLLSGSRAELLIRNVVVVLVIFLGWLAMRQSKARSNTWPFSVAQATVVVVCVSLTIAIFTGYRTFVRESRGQADTSQVLSQVRELPGAVLLGSEAAAFDIMYFVQRSSGQYRRGWADIASVTALSSLPVDPQDLRSERGGHILTEQLWPSLRQRGGNVAISGVVDLYTVGGPALAALGFFLLGLVTALAVRFPVRHATLGSAGGLAIVFAAAAMSLVLSVFRSDWMAAGVLPMKLALISLAMAFAVRPSR